MSAPTESIPNTFAAILEWSRGLPDWQRDALRRLFQQHELIENDYQEILELFKAESGLSSKSTVSARRLSEKDIPSYSSTGSRIVLEGMRELKNVNALVPGQMLKFNPTGMTIVYGHNASGKSGYARVLKKACRARGEKETVLPNVFTTGAIPSPAEAIIDVNDSSKSIPLAWREGEESPDTLAGVNVFDAKSAGVYVDGSNDVAYVPTGLDVFDKLSKLMERLKTDLQSESDSINIDLSQLSDLYGNTAVGKLIQALSHETLIAAIDKCADLSDEEQQRLLDIEKKIAELKVNDPKLKAESIRIKKRRVERASMQIASIGDVISESAVKSIRESERKLIAAEEASKIASQLSFRNEPLEGVTSNPWKMLFSVAKEFSEKFAYPGEEFPVVKQGARCVLCFQELSPEAVERFKKFHNFIQDKTEQALKLAQSDYAGSIKRISDLVIDPFGRDPELLNEILTLNGQIGQSLEEYLKSVGALHSRIKDAITTRNWEETYLFPVAPIESINSLVTTLEKQAKEFDDIAVVGERTRLENEFAELDSKRRLAAKRETVISIVEKLKRKEKIRQSLRATNTLGVSRKSAELMEAVVTDQLKHNLRAEFRNLNVDYIKIDLNKSGRQGVIFHKFKLQSSSHSNANLSDVLSEGEQRALGIASFLAELKTFQNLQPIVFDDPVSSLDHVRREQVACRLAFEATQRQVIIFTHDLVFLTALCSACDGHGASYGIQTLWGNPTGTGYCDPNAPWDGQKVSDRIAYLRGRSLPKMKSICNQPALREDLERRIDDFYKKLRQSWERAIEEVVFNDAIQRFRDSIETNRLKRVQFTDEDFTCIEEGMSECSKYVHDKATSKGGVPLPDPSKLEADLDKLDQFVTRIRKRNDEIAKKR
jgi:energy-coupling factor transporter ATP-binding protein EcfA2